MDIEKAAILAAGKGTRMGKLKPMVKIDGVEMILYHLERLRRVGIRDVLIVVSHDGEAELRLLLEKRSPIGPVSIVVQEEQDGEVGAIKCLKIDVPFILIEVDAFVRMESLFKLTAQESCTMTVAKVKDTDALSKVVVNHGFVTGIVEKAAGGNVADAGAYMFMPFIFEMAKLVKPSSRGELEMTSLLNLLIAERQLRYVVSDSWFHFTTPKDVVGVGRVALLS